MNLDDAQKKRVSQWINEGLKLSEIQKRISSELGLSLTYMEVRLLVDDLKLTPKDIEPAKPVQLGPQQAGPGAAPSQPRKGAAAEPEEATWREEMPVGAGGVAVKLDQVTRPGALASGSVTFSDGQSAAWYLDQLGRLGLVPKEPGYKPSATDLQEFQLELQDELAKAGY
jgi:hypothetical protein